MTDVRLTQGGRELLYAPDPDVRVTQGGRLVLYATSPDARVTQAGRQVLRSSVDAFASTAVLVTQAGRLVLATSATVALRVSGVALESVQQYGDVPARVSGVGLEAVQQYGDVPARVSGVGLETIRRYASAPARVSQVGVEVLYAFNGICFYPEGEPEAPEIVCLPVPETVECFAPGRPSVECGPNEGPGLTHCLDEGDAAPAVDCGPNDEGPGNASSWFGFDGTQTKVTRRDH